ncbi:MAG: GNAT family N-acetyltransferase [Planctomycetes bacterium]|nr:GNAT family N-acetyltransferase [Planctomycetota bacterium]
MLVRPAQESDADAIAMFIVMAESEVVARFTGQTEPAAMAAALRQFIVSPRSSRYSLDNNLVAEYEGRVAGAVMCFPADSQPELDAVIIEAINRLHGTAEPVDALFFEGEPGTYYLSTMGVDPAFRGKGIGTALMAGAEQRGRHQGFTLASLLVSVDKERAKSLYERVGYEAVEQIEMEGCGYWRMVKRIA